MVNPFVSCSSDRLPEPLLDLWQAVNVVDEHNARRQHKFAIPKSCNSSVGYWGLLILVSSSTLAIATAISFTSLQALCIDLNERQADQLPDMRANVALPVEGGPSRAKEWSLHSWLWRPNARKAARHSRRTACSLPINAENGLLGLLGSDHALRVSWLGGSSAGSKNQSFGLIDGFVFGHRWLESFFRRLFKAPIRTNRPGIRRCLPEARISDS